MLSVIYALSVANKPYMQSVVMLSVVEPNVQLEPTAVAQ